MYAIDFEYDNKYLSDYGFIICTFDSAPGLETVDAGSKITFNTVSTHHGGRYSLQSTKYDECIQATFQICKDPCTNESLKITNDEYRDLMRWLNRREYLRFNLRYNETDIEACYYDASFNIDKLYVSGRLIGLELTMETNRPFGYGNDYIVKFNVENIDKEYTFMDVSDEIGYTYPDMSITVKEDGNLRIYNDMEDCTMVVNKCKAGEVITIKGEQQIITTSLPSHKINNDFNFDFLRIGNVADERRNNLKFSIKCDVVISYKPIIKNSPY